MTKRPDLLLVGQKLRQLRREKGLCAAAFAQEIAQPCWLVTLLESAHTEASQRLLELLPDHVFDVLLREVCEVYGVSRRWLTTRLQSAKHPPAADNAPDPDPIALPFAMLPEDAITLAVTLMDITLALPRNDLELSNRVRQGIQSVMLLFNLQLAQLRADGQAELADDYHRRFRQLVGEHLMQFGRQLGFSDTLMN